MIHNVISTIEENKMINKGEKIIVALSGGPDSMSLLHCLNALKAKYDITLYAAHVNHMLRGEDSDNDERACREFCETLGIEFFSKNMNIDIISKEKNISHEMAGREVRYEFFMELLHRHNANKIALAHNLNDQAETILMRLMRGSGVEGLIGIKPVRDDIFIRPLINTKRIEIETYCKENNLPVRIDKTNFESIYSRNKVRLELIPYMEENFNSDIITTLSRMSSIMSIDNNFLEENSSKLFQKYCDTNEERVIIYKDAFNLHYAMLNRIIRKAMLYIKGNMYNIESIHIQNIIQIQKGETGKTTKIPGEILASNVYKDIHLVKEQHQSGKEKTKDFSVDLTLGENIVPELKSNFTLRVIKREEYSKIKYKEDTKYFDFDKINNISIRFRQEGDKFSPIGMNGSKKLKDLLMDLKIPRDKRDNIPLLCFDEHIGWIIGYRISEKFKVNNQTNNILEVKMERQESYE